MTGTIRTTKLAAGCEFFVGAARLHAACRYTSAPLATHPRAKRQNDATDAGWSSPVAREAHNLEVVGSNPAPATQRKADPIGSAFSFVAHAIFAQITITQADMPSVNDTIRFTNAPVTNLNFFPTNTGANKTWDFSSLSYTAQEVNQYKSSFSTPYLLYFLNKIGLKIPDIGFTGFQLTNMYAFYSYGFYSKI